jgi:hypothetical protein
MPSLREIVSEEQKRASVVDDACRVLDLEVSDKTGMGGMAIKAAYKVVKGLKPGFIREVVNNLLDDFLEALDPLYQEAQEKGEPPGAYLVSNRGRAADALLAITDRRSERAKNATIKKLYGKLRPSAKKQVEAAAPRLGEMLGRHAGQQ